MATVITSTFLYSVAIWSTKRKNFDKLERIQRRMALNICSGYQTASKEATLVIAGPSLPLLTRVREERHGGAEEKQAMESI